MYRRFRRQKFGVRFTALVVTSAFLYAEAVQAQGISQFTFSQSIPNTKTTVPANPLQGVELSPEIGEIQEVHVAEEKPFIIHIQDSHANYQAQQNIIKILNRLVHRQGKSQADQIVFCLEGAKGVLDPSFFRLLSNPQAKRAVADFYLRKGKITAAEFFALTDPSEIPLRGIEKASLYEENIARVFV